MRIGPLYNIRIESPTVSIIDIALPGFTLVDVEAELTPDRKLIVRSNGVELPGALSISQFGLGPFVREFSLNGTVTKATMKDGVLSIRVEKNPMPKNIKINIEAPDAEKYPQILNEDSDF
jgi:HSP20 family molecular chaperone IbpA